MANIEIQLNYNDLLGLVRGSVLTFIDNFSPNNYRILLGDENLVTFNTNKSIDPKNFIEKVNNSINLSIKERLNDKLTNLQKEEEIITNRITNRFQNTKQNIKNSIVTLKLEKQAMNSQFQNLLEEDLDSNKLRSLEAGALDVLIKLKTEYHEILSKISFYEKINKIKNYQELQFMSSSTKYAETRPIKNFLEEQKFDEKVLDNLKARIFETEKKLNSFKKYNQKIFYSVDDWRIQSNKFSSLEIVAAGILFGILINAVLLFLTSNYLKINLDNRKNSKVKK